MKSRENVKVGSRPTTSIRILPSLTLGKQKAGKTVPRPWLCQAQIESAIQAALEQSESLEAVDPPLVKNNRGPVSSLRSPAQIASLPSGSPVSTKIN
ncbi:hypothetical protein Zmor_009495 [Zophobas morio]|uniref:Uncharacterized protein n=1 Tax=Zophobas morio TaxID=2755281 RepID=A0AA38MI25_9CUCU|nr:hypothetical protein Zmor_009495 [Zophobas morio]